MKGSLRSWVVINGRRTDSHEPGTASQQSVRCSSDQIIKHRVEAAGALHDGDYRRTQCSRGMQCMSKQQRFATAVGSWSRKTCGGWVDGR